ncbi:MAG: SPFH domain-containing protein [Woeseiaceae bacterium]|nr:SPFH domain-containing protein [Woeseiaceae bacterium]
MFWEMLTIAIFALAVGTAVWLWRRGTARRDGAERRSSAEMPSGLKKAGVAIVVLALTAVTFNEVFFYAEPGYIYHVRTITGNERVVDGVGYSMHLFGRVNAWKKAMTVLADDTTADGVNAEGEASTAAASLPPLNIMFLDQVDADAMAAVRFRLPTDEATFLRMAHEYRTPENLLRVALIPSFQETLQATASLMSAEDYYSGGRTEFINEFENQMQKGVYIVKRKEILRDSIKRQTAEADASDPEFQDEFGDQQKTVFVVEKLLNQDTGLPLRKEQKFTLYGITVHEARVTNMKPNEKFVRRMEQKQEASAMRAIAREQKVQEEEQRLLAIARGDREVAERQAAMKVEQVEATTKAETRKKETLIEAERRKQEAEIQEETSKILLSKARIDAEAVKVAADAEAYKKAKILSADNALAQKLDAEIEIQKIWADAFAKRAVPQYVFGSGQGDAVPVGSDMEVKNFMQLMTLDAAKRLSYERSLQASSQ